MACLVDANLLIALLHARHRHSPRAVQWLDQQEPTSVSICRLAQMGALWLLTPPAMTGCLLETMSSSGPSGDWLHCRGN